MKDFYRNMSKYLYPLYILVHPVDGYHEMKYNKKYSLRVANIVLAFWVLLKILLWGYVDFDFKTQWNEVQLFQILLTSVVIFAIAIISNWCFCTLMDGKGRFLEIWISCAYALIPYVSLGFIRTVLTYIMAAAEEAVFLSYLNIIGVVWTVLLLFIALYVVHDYTGPKTVGSILLTILGVLIIAFLVVLLSGLATQIYSFFATIYFELKLRLL